MAIVKMNKISIIGLQNEKDNIIESLMNMGVVEISSLNQKVIETEWLDVVQRDGNEEQVLSLETDISKLKIAIDNIARYKKVKKGLFETKRRITFDEYGKFTDNSGKLWDTVDKLGDFDAELTVLRAEENKLINLVMSLEPWSALEIPLDITNTAVTSILLGITPSVVETDKMQQELYENVPESHFELINRDKDQNYNNIIFYSKFEADVMHILKKYGFTKVDFKGLEGTVEQNIQNAANRINQIEKKRRELEKKISELADVRADLELLYDHVVIKSERLKILSRIVKTEKAFMLEGWLPTRISGKVKEEISNRWECVIEIKEPEKDEESPVLLENNSFVKPFELVSELYSLPSSKGIDANIFMAPFYFLFFGLMVSDAGYGIVISAITGIILAKYKPKGMAYKLIKLLFFGGISTFIWGVLFGGWFGDIFQLISGGTFEIKPLWFNPLKDPMKLLLWSFIFGGVQIFTGMGIQAYKLIRDGKPWDALFDIGFWYVLLIGLVLLIIGGNIGVIGKYMSITGTALLVITQGRNEKGIIKKFLFGLLSLYNITGFLSDVLSYSRLLALGLATGVIASVVNTMGTLFCYSPLGIAILAIVFVAGHLFNIAINALGAYVHASRLQYVEFFGKFFEGGGKSFEPFKINTKYVELIDKEAV